LAIKPRTGGPISSILKDFIFQEFVFKDSLTVFSQVASTTKGPAQGGQVTGPVTNGGGRRHAQGD
jgi:hypothetical protein